MDSPTLFQYTHEKSRLSEDQKQFYERNGYLLIKNNVEDKLLNEVRQRFLDICNGEADPGFMTVMKDKSLMETGAKGERLINKIQDFLFDDVLWKYCIYPSVVDIVECIIGPNITAVHSMFLNKPPGGDPKLSLHPLHQDLHYFPFRPANNIVASWTAVENVDETNGCLFVVPGTHTGQLYKHDYAKDYKNKMYHGIPNLDHLVRLTVPMEKGDTIFFHPLLLHGSGPNLTKGYRKAISCHYADSNCQFIDVRGTTQENIAKEIEELAAKKGVSLLFADVWKSKSRLVRGDPGNFQKYSSHL
ncbi:phytanoyl-CoA dioxygenase, peroxisomal [Aethina tumida]|uniref:phytanoyl-CoA dioxygenase, peroxisomal n=1 Tax=Aethina tumida TaxID=116153 RepID=UPI00096B37C6|nr:phytanoyl-CoA dioxygenase, peroxisomal [Aethina tumida]